MKPWPVTSSACGYSLDCKQSVNRMIGSANLMMCCTLAAPCHDWLERHCCLYSGIQIQEATFCLFVYLLPSSSSTNFVKFLVFASIFDGQ